MATDTAGWYADPTNRHLYRYWDGGAWSDRVSDGGTAGVDPTPLDETLVGTPPAPGTQAPGPGQAEPTPQVEVSQRSGGFGLGTIVGVVIGLLVVILLVVTLLNGLGDEEPADEPDTPVTTVAPDDDAG